MPEARKSVIMTPPPATREVPTGPSVLTFRFNGDGQNLDSFSLTRIEPVLFPDQAAVPLDPDHDGI